MSESSSKSSQPLASKQEKDGTEKRGRGRPRKQPPVSPGTALVGSQVGVQALPRFTFWAREVWAVVQGTVGGLRPPDQESRGEEPQLAFEARPGATWGHLPRRVPRTPEFLQY